MNAVCQLSAFHCAVHERSWHQRTFHALQVKWQRQHAVHAASQLEVDNQVDDQYFGSSNEN